MSFVQNLVGFVKKSALSKIGQSDTVNMYVEKKDQSEHGFSVVLKPMPGYRKVCDINGVPRGTFRCSRSYDNKSAVYGVWGSRLYLIAKKEDEVYQPIEIGVVSGGEGKVSFCETNGYGSTSPRLIVCDGLNLYSVPTNKEPVFQRQEFKAIQLPFKYPNSTTERIRPSWVASMYNYIIVGDEGTDIFYVSHRYPFDDGNEDVFDVKETGLGHFVMSEWQPDNTVAGCGNGSRLFTLGEKSFQVFTYQNSVDMPFASPDTASVSIGIKSKGSLAQFGSSIFWIGGADMGNGSVWTMGPDANPVRISTDEIEDLIDGYDFDNVESFVMKVGNHPLYVLNFQTDKKTLAYDVREEGWIRLSSRDRSGCEGAYRYSNAVLSPDGKTWLQSFDGLVETTVDTWFEHDGTPILRKRVGGVVSSEHKSFKVSKIQLITNNGDYPLVKGRPALVSMRYSMNGTTWHDVTTRSLGRVGQYDYDTVFRNLGKAKHFIIEFSSSENIPFALYGMDLQAIKTND